jgi:hypothetical protein
MAEWEKFWLVLFGGIALFAGVITLLDWLARRKDRESEKRPTP